jgi:hypothetical protein
MSMRKQPLGEVPENTARVARKALGKKNIYVNVCRQVFLPGATV